MKKLFTLFAAASLAATVSAQTVTESKTFDNFYIGVNGGVSTVTTGHSWLNNLNPNAGLRMAVTLPLYLVWLLKAMLTSLTSQESRMARLFVSLTALLWQQSTSATGLVATKVSPVRLR